jgi:hypothetical protein
MSYEVQSLSQYIRKLAIDYMRYNYVHYVTGVIPSHKNPAATDQKLIEHYEITSCRTTRSKRKKAGFANVQYIRWGNFFTLIATEGESRFFVDEKPTDIRVAPLHLKGYSIGMKGDTPCVMIAPKRLKAIRRYLAVISLHHERRVRNFLCHRLPKLKYPRVLRQNQAIIREMNRRRKKAHLPPIMIEAVASKAR